MVKSATLLVKNLFFQPFSNHHIIDPTDVFLEQVYYCILFLEQTSKVILFLFAR